MQSLTDPFTMASQSCFRPGTLIALQRYFAGVPFLHRSVQSLNCFNQSLLQFLACTAKQYFWFQSVAGGQYAFLKPKIPFFFGSFNLSIVILSRLGMSRQSPTGSHSLGQDLPAMTRVWTFGSNLYLSTQPITLPFASFSAVTL